MRDMRVVAVASFSLLISLATCANAQMETCSPVPVMQAMMPFGLMSPRLAFTGVVKTSFEQKLYDGNTIRSVTHSRQARDSAGRTRTEFTGGCMPGEDGQMHPNVSVSVQDPVAHTSENWQEGATMLPKIVHVFHQQQLKAPNKPLLTPEEQEQHKQMAERLRQMNESRANQRPNFSREDLGTRQLNGISAKGVRTTETIPAGAQGNDLPLTIVNETWTAVGTPGLILMRISDDPRRGRTVSEFEELKLGEPDESLFAPPADYKLQELNAGGSGGGVVLGTAMSGVSVQ